MGRETSLGGDQRSPLVPQRERKARWWVDLCWSNIAFRLTFSIVLTSALMGGIVFGPSWYLGVLAGGSVVFFSWFAKLASDLGLDVWSSRWSQRKDMSVASVPTASTTATAQRSSPETSSRDGGA